MKYLLILLTLLIHSTALFAEEAPKTTDETILEKATFAGGCFWCMEKPFDKIPGVTATISGYMGGHKKDPTYKEVSAGTTGHAEVIQITYNPETVSYKQLVDAFWKNIDPLVADRQFCDGGTQYRSGIFYHDEDQKKIALASKKQLEDSKRFDKPIRTEITEADTFYRAEEYHQDYYKKNPIHYYAYRKGCGRDSRLEELWGK